jgi:hypothetical protein
MRKHRDAAHIVEDPELDRRLNRIEELRTVLTDEADQELRLELAADNLGIIEAATKALVDRRGKDGLAIVLTEALGSDPQAAGTIYELIYGMGGSVNSAVDEWLDELEAASAEGPELLEPYRRTVAWHDS